jgi:hypothetical protein
MPNTSPGAGITALLRDSSVKTFFFPKQPPQKGSISFLKDAAVA